MPVSRPFRALAYPVCISYNYYDNLCAIKQRASKPSRVRPWGLFFLQEGGDSVKPWAERFYNSDAWRVCREAFLQSKGCLCERCSTPDDPVVAKIAHHKTYLTKANINNPYITLSWDNLEALCQDCHNKEHHRSTRKKRYSFDANGNLVYPPHSTR